MMRRFALPLLSCVLLSFFSGCGGLETPREFDERAVSRALDDYRDRTSLISLQTSKDAGEEWPEDDASHRRGSMLDVVIAELIAIGPGMVVQGLGHRYAGDYRTSDQLMRVGAVGVGVGALGVGLAVGGNEITEDWIGDAVGGAGIGISAIGAGYYLAAWLYDIYDTPRAVRSGGRPPPGSPFVESLDFIGGE